jgi:hypothetical protein
VIERPPNGLKVSSGTAPRSGRKTRTSSPKAAERSVRRPSGMLREGETVRIFDCPASRAPLPSLYGSLAGKASVHFSLLGGPVEHRPGVFPGDRRPFQGAPVKTSGRCPRPFLGAARSEAGRPRWMGPGRDEDSEESPDIGVEGDGLSRPVFVHGLDETSHSLIVPSR